ncbi:TolC family protein [Pseudoalteromonas piratica]|uniref:Lipoprotein n=1 Tax=Pseudoalteromonas piratica TaxID=1348114 RepID=A0A0A7EHY0_9GAMM|nr:TolC family protein [Pseudoalteromonas piratica]AIY66123.1 lipoprotein [Pseudoalteromonas piratica]
MYKYVKHSGVFLTLAVAVSFTSIAYSKQENVTWIDTQINKDPEVIEARELLKASDYRAKSLTQAVYNPDFEASFDKEGDFNNYSIGISQTIDLWDKRAINDSIGKIAFYASQQQLLDLLESKKANAIQAIVTWQAAKEASLLVIEREKQLKTLLNIVEEKLDAGILEPLDAELVYLNLSQVFIQIAEYQTALKTAEVKVRELLPDWTPELQNKLSFSIDIENYTFKKEWIEEHPTVLQAKALWHEQKLKAQLTSIEYKANPTIGISAGKNNDDNIVGLTFSMPMNIRNDYSDVMKAANLEAIAAEANFQSKYRRQSFEAQAKFESLITNKKYFEKWKNLMQNRLGNSLSLLNARWEAGDINTSDYLFTFSQRTEGLLSGIQLKKQFKLSEVSFIQSIGQISKFEI